MQNTIKLTEYESQVYEDMWVIKAGTLRTLGGLNKELEEASTIVEALESRIDHLETTLEDRERKILAGLSAQHGVAIPAGLDLPAVKPKDGRIVLSWKAPKAKGKPSKPKAPAKKKAKAKKKRAKRSRKKTG